MSYDWNNYFRIATCLKNNSAIDISLEETRYRCAISRFYYSLHNLIKIELDKKLQKDLSIYSRALKGSHRLIIDLLYSSNSKNVRYIGAGLEELKEMREDSDYRMSNFEKIDNGFKTAADSAFIIANDLLNTINIISDPSNNIDNSMLT